MKKYITKKEKGFVQIPNSILINPDINLIIDSDHIEYIIECVSNNKTKIKNIKQYLLAAIFDAPNTIGSYYTTKVNHDLYG